MLSKGFGFGPQPINNTTKIPIYIGIQLKKSGLGG